MRNSTRRELDAQHYQEASVAKVDTSGWSRDELEKEVQRLHDELARSQLSDAHHAAALREMYSHLSTGTDVADGAARPNMVQSSGQEEADTSRAAAEKTGRKNLDHEPPTAVHEQLALNEVLAKAGKRALGGGLPGAAAMVVQVGGLMWLRTTMNYQYRHGTSTLEAMRYLYKNGGIPRFYQGAGPALIQGPLARFVRQFLGSVLCGAAPFGPVVHHTAEGSLLSLPACLPACLTDRPTNQPTA
jgi:hypothetical protein|eukprot:COSAG01_NODE_1010_length_12149_cov_12.245892_9_plen_244_part_00